MAVDVLCREPTSRRESASAAVLVVPLIYLMYEVNWAMNSRCLSRRGKMFLDWEVSKSEWFVVGEYMELATLHKVAEMADGEVDGQ